MNNFTSKCLNRIHEIQNNEVIHKLGNYAFWFSIIIELMIVVVDKSAFRFLYEGRAFQITFLLCLIKVLCTKYEWREYIAIFLCCLVGLMVDQMGDKNEILRMFMFVASCKDIDMKKCFKLVFWITSVGCLMIMSFSIFGIGGNVIELKEYAIAGQEMKENIGRISLPRYTFGMGHPNTFHIMILVVVLLGLFVYREKAKWWVYLLVLSADVGLYKLTDARTPTIMLAATAVGMGVIKHLEILKYKCDKKNIIVDLSPTKNETSICGKKINIWRWILNTGSFLMWAISIACIEVSFYFASVAWRLYEYKWSRLYWHEVKNILRADEILTGRILNLMNYDNRAGSIWTWTWLPDATHEELFDLGYVRMFYRYGNIATIFIILVFVGLFTYLVVEEKYSDAIFIVIIAIFTFVEAHFVSEYIGRNYLAFLLGMYWGEMLRMFSRGGKMEDMRYTN